MSVELPYYQDIPKIRRDLFQLRVNLELHKTGRLTETVAESSVSDARNDQVEDLLRQLVSAGLHDRHCGTLTFLLQDTMELQ